MKLRSFSLQVFLIGCFLVVFPSVDIAFATVNWGAGCFSGLTLPGCGPGLNAGMTINQPHAGGGGVDGIYKVQCQGPSGWVDIGSTCYSTAVNCTGTPWGTMTSGTSNTGYCHQL